jgi:hypothetical protein
VKKRIIAEEPPDEEEKPKPKLSRSLGNRNVGPPTVPPHARPRSIGIKNLGYRPYTADATDRESAKPPTPPDFKAVVAREQKAEVSKVQEKIQKAKTDTQEEKAKADLDALKAKQKADFDARVKAARDTYLRKYYDLPANASDRDLADAQSKLKQSVAMYRRGQQRRNILTGRGKTARN